MQSEVMFTAHAEPGGEPVRSPVTDQPCVYWRLRIVERLTARSELVHELSSSQPFRLVWGARGGRKGWTPPQASEPGVAPVRILVEPDAARIEATPTLHREGSPGALAVARAFGFPGGLSVQEISIHPGDEIAAAGTLYDPRYEAGPFRTVEREPELLNATLTLSSETLGQALLPWAVGTAAAVLGGIGLATWAASHYHAHHGGAHAARMGHPPAYLERPQFPHPRLP